MKANAIKMTKELSAKIVKAAQNSEQLNKIKEEAIAKHLAILKNNS